MKTEKSDSVKNLLSALCLLSLIAFLVFGIMEKEFIVDAVYFFIFSAFFGATLILYNAAEWFRKKLIEKRIRNAKNFSQLSFALRKYRRVFNYYGEELPGIFQATIAGFYLPDFLNKELVIGFENFNKFVGKRILEILNKRIKKGSIKTIIELKAALYGSSIQSLFDKEMKENLQHQKTSDLILNSEEIIEEWIVETIQQRLKSNNGLLNYLANFPENEDLAIKKVYLFQIYQSIYLSLEPVIDSFSYEQLREVYPALEGKEALQELVLLELGKRLMSTMNDKPLPEISETGEQQTQAIEPEGPSSETKDGE